VEFKRVKQRQPRLGEAFVESLEVGLDHHEVEWTFKCVLVEHRLQVLYLRRELVFQVVTEGRQISCKHEAHVWHLLNLRMECLRIVLLSE
jgi:hypothetical protein